MGAEMGAPECQITEAMVEAAAKAWVNAQAASNGWATGGWDSPLTPVEYRVFRREWARAALVSAFRAFAPELRGEARS